MNAKTFIRACVYVLYTILMLPVIVLGLVVTPFIWARVFTKEGFTISECAKTWCKALMDGIRHDLHYIQTGEW